MRTNAMNVWWLHTPRRTGWAGQLVGQARRDLTTTTAADRRGAGQRTSGGDAYGAQPAQLARTQRETAVEQRL